MKRRTAGYLLFGFLLSMVLGGGARAELKLEISMRPLAAAPRADAPMLLLAEFFLEGAEVLEGTLEMEFQSHGSASYTIDEIPVALTKGRQTRTFLVPPPVSSRLGGQIRLRGRVNTDRGSFPFSIYPLTAELADRRSFLIGECCLGAFSNTETSVRDALRLEYMDPARASIDSTKVVRTGRALIRPADMFSDPMHYCAFDVMVVAARGLDSMRQTQLAALGTWVRGGGSLCVFAFGSVRQDTVDYLNQLDPAGSYTLGPDDRLVWSAGADDALRLGKPGIGRLAVWCRKADMDSAGARDAIAFLWKLTDQQARHFRQTGTWDDALVRGREVNNYYYDDSPRVLLGTREPDSLASLRSLLMPSTVSLMPFSVVVLILAIFIAAVGPGDYFLLGIIRRRRWTWLLLPVVSVAVTWVTVNLAEGYMGANTRHNLSIVDVDEQGRVVRFNRLELIYASNEGTVGTPVHEPAFFTRMPQYDTMDAGYNQGYPSYAGDEVEDDRTPVTYHGQYPYNYIMDETVRQWTPVVNRLFCFTPPKGLDLLELDWQAVKAADLEQAHSRQGEQALLEKLGQEPRPGLQAHVAGARTLPQWLVDLCVPQNEGLHKLVTRVSPAGCGGYEDLPLWDYNREDDKLLVVIETRGESHIVYRRLYKGGEER